MFNKIANCLIGWNGSEYIKIILEKCKKLEKINLNRN